MQEVSVGIYTIDENHDKDIFVAKMDSNGQWLWANSIHHYGIETASSIAVSQSGEVYIGGNKSCDGSESPAIFPTTARNEIIGGWNYDDHVTITSRLVLLQG